MHYTNKPIEDETMLPPTPPMPVPPPRQEYVKAYETYYAEAPKAKGSTLKRILLLLILIIACIALGYGIHCMVQKKIKIVY
jgi:hypothetical protein